MPERAKRCFAKKRTLPSKVLFVAKYGAKRDASHGRALCAVKLLALKSTLCRKVARQNEGFAKNRSLGCKAVDSKE
jgi:hypothetical protein